MKSTRIYKSKDVEMLLVATTIMEAAIAQKDFLQSKRTIWKDPFFEKIKTKIDTAIQEYLGQDNARALRNATLLVLEIQNAARKDLTEFKIQLEVDFNDNPLQKKELLNTLGFTPYYKQIKNKDQEGLINLLYQFKTNMTPDLQASITAKGTPDVLIDAIKNYADQFKNLNVAQESKKGNRKELTDEAIIAFNAVYNEVMAVAKIATNFFKDQPAIKEQFSFAKVKSNLNNTKNKTTPPVL